MMATKTRDPLAHHYPITVFSYSDDNCSMEPKRKRTQYTVEELHKNNWWTAGARLRGGMEVVGTNPKGELISCYPEKLQLPNVVWITKWGIAVDKWVFLGLGMVSKPGFVRLSSWLSAWAAERKDMKPVIVELVEELEYRLRHLEDEACTRASRAFFFTLKSDANSTPEFG